MGTIKQGILGGFNGKVGTVIGASWKGITYMRGIAASNSNPQTEAQLDQRARFVAFFSQWLQRVDIPRVNVSWTETNGKASALACGSAEISR